MSGNGAEGPPVPGTTTGPGFDGAAAEIKSWD